jgi:hypothetical protein
MELKPATLPFVDTLLNIVIKEFPVAKRFACYNCGMHQSSKVLSVGTAPSGKKIRICLTCREHYIKFFVRKMIDKVIVPALVREYLESLKASADTPPSNGTAPPRASVQLPRHDGGRHRVVGVQELNASCSPSKSSCADA